MKATVIVDNKKSEDLKGEWGLCIYIEYDGQNILLDAGSIGFVCRKRCKTRNGS